MKSNEAASIPSNRRNLYDKVRLNGEILRHLGEVLIIETEVWEIEIALFRQKFAALMQAKYEQRQLCQELRETLQASFRRIV